MSPQWLRCALEESRYLSHQLRLLKNREPIDLFCGQIRGLGKQRV